MGQTKNFVLSAENTALAEEIADKILKKMEKVEEICNSLEGLDCGSCGAPSCRALAEDVVRGLASVDDCIFHYKDSIHVLLKDLHRLEQAVPAPFRTEEKEEKTDDTH